MTFNPAIGSFRYLNPIFDSEVNSYGYRAIVWSCGNVHRLISMGNLIAEINDASDSEPVPKVVVYDFFKIDDASPSRQRHRAMLRHVAEFLHEFGFTANTAEEIREFIPPEGTALPAFTGGFSEPAPIIPGNWVKHIHPRNSSDVWYTCSECGNLASADNGRDILSPFCPNCGKPMTLPEPEPVAESAVHRQRLINSRPGLMVEMIGDKMMKATLNGIPQSVKIMCRGKWKNVESMSMTHFYERLKRGTLQLTDAAASA